MINIKFESAALPADTFQIVKMDGEEEISHLFRFELQLVSRDPDIDFKAVLQAGAHIAIETQDNTRYLHGMLSEFEQFGEWQNGIYEYRAVVVPRLWIMSQSTQNQIFQDQTVPEIIESELSSIQKKGNHPLVMNGLSVDDYEIYTVEDYEEKEREYVVQYKETDLNFISRLMEHEGIYYYFEHDENREKLVITDAMATEEIAGDSYAEFMTEAATARYDRNVVYKLSRSQKQIPGSVMVTDFNYREPSVPMQSDDCIVLEDGIGFVTEFGAHFKGPDLGQKLANIRAEEFRCRENLFAGESNIAAFSCGGLYSLGQHFRAEYNQTYMITRVEHHASQEIESWGNVGNTNYHNAFNCIPSELPYRPQRLTPKPKLYGIMNGTIDSEQDLGRADLDEFGRYKVKMPFDMNGVAPGMASRRIRMAQPYGGAGDDGGGIGMSFPLLKGTEVIWTCIDGDIDRPIITGVVPNPLQPSVTNTKNANSNMIRTASGIAMGFHDGTGGGAGQNTTGGGAVGDLAPQRQFQSTNPNLQSSQQSQNRVAESPVISAVSMIPENAILQPIEQQQQKAIQDYQLDLGGTDPEGDRGTGKLWEIQVPDYDGNGKMGAEGEWKNNDSYLRLGKVNASLIQELEMDEYGGQRVGGEDDEEGTDSLDGWFDYTDGNHVSITQGKRTDVVNGGDYTRILTNGGLKTNDPSPVHLDYFRPVATGWRRTTHAYLSSDTFTWGDSEDFFAGFNFDGMLGMNADLSLGPNLNVAWSKDVDIKWSTSYVFGHESSFELIEGNKYSFAKNDSLEASQKIEIYVEANDIPNPNKALGAGMALAATALGAIGGGIAAAASDTDDAASDVAAGAGIAMAAGMFVSAIAMAKKIKTIKNNPTYNPLDRETQIVLDKKEVLINASEGSGAKDGSEILLSGDNEKGIVLKAGDSSIIIKKDCIILNSQSIELVSKKGYLKLYENAEIGNLELTSDKKITSSGTVKCKEIDGKLTGSALKE